MKTIMQITIDLARPCTISLSLIFSYYNQVCVTIKGIEDYIHYFIV